MTAWYSLMISLLLKCGQVFFFCHKQDHVYVYVSIRKHCVFLSVMLSKFDSSLQRFSQIAVLLMWFLDCLNTILGILVYIEISFNFYSKEISVSFRNSKEILLMHLLCNCCFLSWYFLSLLHVWINQKANKFKTLSTSQRYVDRKKRFKIEK